MVGLSTGGIIVDIILFLIIAGNAVLGYRRGLIKVVFNLFSSIIAIILVLILYKPTTNFIINNTSASEKLEAFFEEKLEYLVENNDIENKEELQEENDMVALLDVFIGDDIENMVRETSDSIIEYISVQVSYKIISTLVFFMLFAIIRLLLYILRSYIELIANLPIIRNINSSGGMVYGVIKGFFIIYVVFALISLMMPIIGNTIIITSIQDAIIGSKMFNHNLILNLIFRFL